MRATSCRSNGKRLSALNSGTGDRRPDHASEAGRGVVTTLHKIAAPGPRVPETGAFLAGEGALWPWLRAAVLPAIVAGGLGGFAGCAAAPVARHYQPLPSNASVAVVRSLAELPQPAVVIGKVRAKTDGSADRDAVVESFMIRARAQGCNALAAVASTESDVVGPKLVRVTRSDGSVATEKQMAITGHEVSWSALCVRAADDAGVAARPTKKAAKAAANPPEPSAPVAAVRPPPPKAEVAVVRTPAAPPPPAPPEERQPAPKPAAVAKPAEAVAKPAAAPPAKPRPPAPRPAPSRAAEPPDANDGNEAPAPMPI